MTPAQKHVAEQLARLVGEGTEYGVGALFLAYDNGDPNGCNVAQGLSVGDGVPLDRAGVQLSNMIKALRHAADSLQRQIDEHARAKRDADH